MSDTAAEERRAKAAERQARLLAKSQARLEKITGAAKGEGRIISDCTLHSPLELLSLLYRAHISPI